MKLTFPIIFPLLGASLFLGACKPAGNSSTADSSNNGEKKLTLAVIPKSTGGEFWETVERGARKAGDELGVNLKWEGTVTETEVAEQNKIIENMINLGVDGLALAPINAKAQVKSAKSADEAGIPVIAFDSAMENGPEKSFIATDNKLGGVLAGEHLAKKLNNTGKVVVLRFVQGTSSTEARADGFIEAAKKAGLEVVSDVYPDSGTVEGAKNTAANTLEGYISDNKLQVDGIFAANLLSTLGMSSALEDLRKGGIEVNASFVGFDTSDKLLKQVTSGQIEALVAQNPERMGYLAVKTLHNVVTKQPFEDFIDTGVFLVTKDELETNAEMRASLNLK